MRNFVCLFLCLSINLIHAQGSLTGKVVDQDNKPLGYFNLVLLVPGDSSIMASAAFTNGVFAINNIKTNTYILKITSFGYVPSKQRVEVTNESNQLSTIVLQPNVIKGVTVTAQRPTILCKADRTIINVEGSVLANSLNGNDMLQKTPGLIRDPNGELIIAGKGAPKYYIDGKEVYLMTEVKMLNPQNIKSIEIVDNPSAAYDADGHAVVLINTIRRMDQYLVRFGGNFTQSRRGSGSGFVEGTLKAGTVTSNLYINHSINNNKTFDNDYSKLPSNIIMDTHAASIWHDSETSYRLSVDMDIAKNQTLTFQSNGFVDNTVGSKTQLSHFSSMSLSDFNTHMNDSEKSWQNNGTIGYNYKIDTLGQNIKIVGDYTVGNDQDTNKFYNQLVGEENNIPFWNNNESTGEPVIFTIKGDYAKPLNKKTTLETGLKYYWIKSDNITNLTGSTNLNQHYRTVEQNLAAYTSLTVKLNQKLEFRAGIRVEQTLRKARKDDVAYMDTTQLGFFPSILINYNYSKNFTAGISYSKRISRPSFSALDPSLYVDSLTNRKGNPNLKSTEIHSFLISLNFLSILSLRAGYNYSIHPIYFLVYKDNLQPQLTDIRFENGDNNGRYNVSLSLNKKLFDWWSITLYGAFYTNSYLYFDENNIQRNNNIPGRNATIQNSINIQKKFTFDIGFQYNGKGSWASIYNEPYWNLYFSLQRSFFHEALTCTLTANDLFNQMTSHQHSVLTGQNINVFDRDDRYIGINIQYKIGKSEYNYSSKSGNSEERQRIH